MEEERQQSDQSSRQERRRELRLKLAMEEEKIRKELEERRRQRDAERRLRDEENRRADEERQRVLKEQKRRREHDFEQRLKVIKREKQGIEHILRKISTRFDTLKSHEPVVIRVLPQWKSKRLFDLFREKKEKYNIEVQDYFCQMLRKSPPPGEVARFFEHFKNVLLDRATKYQSFPINSLPSFEQEDDLKVLLELVDVADKDGFKELYCSEYDSNLELIEGLSKNASAEKRAFVKKQYEDIVSKRRKRRVNPYVKEDLSRFPFLELPVELQFIVLEQLSVGAMLNIRCLCNYFKTLNMPNKHVTRLPQMGIFQLVDPLPYSDAYQCQLTVMATPTVFHFGLIMGEHYKVSQMKNVDTFIHEMTERIERFAKEDRAFRYDIERLKSFLLHSWQHKRRFFIIQQNSYYGQHMVYVELDSSFGIGIEFKSPSEQEPQDYWY